MIASTTSSESRKSSSFVVPRRRARAASRSVAESVPFSTRRLRFFSIDCMPLFKRSSFTSRTITLHPACAATCAMPEPIRPQPTTPTFWMAIPFSSTNDDGCNGSGHGFHNHRDALSAADASGRKAVTGIAAPQFEKQRQNQPRSRRAKRMAEGNRAAIDVDLVAIEAQRLLDGEILRRKRFIHFDQIELLKFQASKLKRFASRRHRADAHDARFDADRGPGNNLAERLPAALFRSLCLSHNDSRSAVHNTAGISGGDDAVLAKSRRKRGEAFHCSVGTPMIILRKQMSLFAFAHLDGDDLFLHAAGAIRGFRGLLAAQSELVRFLARDFIFGGEIFGSVGHRATADGIEKPGHQRVFELSFAEAEAGARSANHVRNLRHVLHAPGKNCLRFAELNALRRLADRLHAGAAEAIHGHRRSLHFQAGLQANMARAIVSVGAALLDVAEDNMVHLSGIYAGTLDCLLGRDRAEVNRRNSGEFAVVARHRRSRAGENDDIRGKHEPS